MTYKNGQWILTDDEATEYFRNMDTIETMDRFIGDEFWDVLNEAEPLFVEDFLWDNKELICNHLIELGINEELTGKLRGMPDDKFVSILKDCDLSITDIAYLKKLELKEKN